MFLKINENKDMYIRTCIYDTTKVELREKFIVM